MRKNKLYNYLVVVAIIFVALIWGAVYNNIYAKPESTGPKIYFLDVGQGDAALLTFSNSIQAIIDMGRGGQVVEQLSHYMPYFDRNIEYAFITHFDADHFGGLDEILESYHIGKIVYPAALSYDKDAVEIESEAGVYGYEVDQVSRGDVVVFDGSINAKVLWPQKSEEGLKGNDLSLVAMVDGPKSKVLTTGDIEKDGQDRLLSISVDDELRADVLKFPHHGAQGAFDKNFLVAVDPDKVVISVGKNSYGHPSQDVIDYFEKLNRKVLRTDTLGTVEIDL